MGKCSMCGTRLTADICTLILGTCDDCLADEAADARANEMACEDVVLLMLPLPPEKP